MEIPRAGIRENLPQFTLLVIVNAFVGAMVGLERSVLPLLGEQSFGLTSHTVILSFLLTFGVVKAFTNLAAGRFADRAGRKKLLVAGWMFGLPVPVLLMFAQDWSWVVAANVFLGVNQGLCWSMAVIMKIDIAGPKRRGFATGINEFAGYLAVALAAFATAEIASAYGLRTAPFSIGVVIAVTGLVLSAFFVSDTRKFVEAEAGSAVPYPPVTGNEPTTFAQVFSLTWRDRRFFALHQAGMVNNLNDGMAWAMFPLFFASLGYSISTIGILTALYPAVWGATQLITGPLSDSVGRRGLISAGMVTQAAGIWVIVFLQDFTAVAAGSVLLGLGTAMVYPTLLASVSDIAHPGWRAGALGVYRFWRDIGYALGALLAGVLADYLGTVTAIAGIGAVTFTSGVVVYFYHHGRHHEKNRDRHL
jgi:MFS family permease